MIEHLFESVCLPPIPTVDHLLPGFPHKPPLDSSSTLANCSPEGWYQFLVTAPPLRPPDGVKNF